MAIINRRLYINRNQEKMYFIKCMVCEMMKTIKWLLGYTMEKRRSIVVGMLLIAFTAVIEILKTGSQKGIVDSFLKNDDFSIVLLRVIFLSMMYMMSGIMFYIGGTYFQKISFHICRKITSDLHKKIQLSKISDYDKERLARWEAVFGDIDNLANELFLVSFKFIDIIKFCMIAIVLCFIDVKVLFLLVIMNGAYVLVMKKMLPVMKQIENDMINRRHNLFIKFEEGSSGLREIVNYSYEENFVQLIERLYNKYICAVRKSITYSNLTEIITSCSKWAGLIVGIFFLYKDVADGFLSIGAFFVGYQYMSQFSELFRLVNNYLSELVSLLARIEKIRDTIETIQEIDLDRGILMSEDVTEVKLNEISFSYDGKKNILNYLSGEIQMGSINLIAGESGKGKSTLIKLFIREYCPVNGDFVINSRFALSEISINSWLSKLAVVRQNPYIFCDSIRNNIVLGRKENSDEVIFEVLEIVNLKEYILSLPEGLDTVIGEYGLDISGGQRQRIAIARAIINHAQILVLDEALSAIDEWNQQKILTGIQKYRPDGTIIMVNHNISVIPFEYHEIRIY